eukprot:TRINITY_DN47578_c0_g1_i1.p1 TRINITY_DN47578_c0_g1~~TRINITY_DN47578_c0_g1_i1.p1  ORF type:complete len:257 (-),score=50.49 TRINITY_DN47578_c0_g1_i1:149-919(-)
MALYFEPATGWRYWPGMAVLPREAYFPWMQTAGGAGMLWHSGVPMPVTALKDTMPASAQDWKPEPLSSNYPEEPRHVLLVNSTSSGAYASLCADAGSADLVAFDTEWAPDWNKSSDNPISVMQLAFPQSQRVYVIQFEQLECRLPREVQMMLVNPGVTKVGFAVSKRDAAKLERTGIAVTQASVLDVQEKCAAALGLPWGSWTSLSLGRAADKLLGYKLDKQCACSDWSSEKLTPQQVRYAALDAWVALRLYDVTC